MFLPCISLFYAEISICIMHYNSYSLVFDFNIPCLQEWQESRRGVFERPSWARLCLLSCRELVTWGKSTGKLWGYTHEISFYKKLVLVLLLRHSFTMELLFMPPPFEEWWRGIKCYPCRHVPASVRYQNLVSAQ